MLKWSVMVLCVLTFRNILTEDPDVCKTIGGQNGTCIALPSCPQFVALLKESTTALAGLNITQMYRCGFDGLNVKICCPREGSVYMNSQLNLTDTNENDFVEEFPSSCGSTHNSRPNCEEELQYLLKGRLAYTGISRWMALLGYNAGDSVWQCGGSIITQRHVLTAGHCIKKSLYVVRLGEIHLNEKREFLSDPQPIDYLVKRTIRHEEYSTFHNDIGLVVLAEYIQFTEHISPVCLPLSSYYRRSIKDVYHGTVTGWGLTEHNKPTLQLLYASVRLYDNDECRNIYKNVTIDDRVLCAGEDQTDSCQGDSGGPLVWRYCVGPNVEEDPRSYYHGIDQYFQVGIVSYGFRCEFSRFKGVYTNITYFLPWIEEKVLGKRSDNLFVTDCNIG